MTSLLAILTLFAPGSICTNAPGYAITYKVSGTWTTHGYDQNGRPAARSGAVTSLGRPISASNQSGRPLSASCQVNAQVEIDAVAKMQNPPKYVWLLVNGDAQAGDAPSLQGNSKKLVSGLTLNDGLGSTVVSSTECQDLHTIRVPLTNGTGSITLSLSGRQFSPAKRGSHAKITLACRAEIAPFGVDLVGDSPSPNYHAGPQDQPVPNSYSPALGSRRIDVGMNLESVGGFTYYAAKGSYKQTVQPFGAWSPKLQVSDNSRYSSSDSPGSITSLTETNANTRLGWRQAFSGEYGKTTVVTGTGLDADAGPVASAKSVIHWHYPVEDLTTIHLADDEEWKVLTYYSNVGPQPFYLSFGSQKYRALFAKQTLDSGQSAVIQGILASDFEKYPNDLVINADGSHAGMASIVPGGTLYLITVVHGHLIADDFYSYGRNGFQGHKTVPSEYYTPGYVMLASFDPKKYHSLEELMASEGCRPYHYLINHWNHYDN